MLSLMRQFKGRPADIGRARSRQLAIWFGRELRLARLNAGLTQAQLASLAGVSQQVVSMVECGDPDVSLDVRCRIAAACGHELGWRLHPVSSVSLRDSGQLSIAQAIVTAAHQTWTSQLEVPVAPGDLRAADLLLGLPDELDHVEIERIFTDWQAQTRSAQVKREIIANGESRPTRLIIAVPDTRLSRERLAAIAPLLQRTFPVPSREIWHAIRRGHPVGGDGILFVRPDRAAARA